MLKTIKMLTLVIQGKPDVKHLLSFVIAYVRIRLTHDQTYVKHVYDCSNMTCDQWYEFRRVGLSPWFMLTDTHVFLYIVELGYMWECTGKYIRCEPTTVHVYETYEEMCKDHRFKSGEFAGHYWSFE